MNSDYHLWVSEAQFAKDFGHPYRGTGWYTSGDDTMLATTDDSGQIRIDVWNGHDPRQRILDFLNLPNRDDMAIVVA